MKKLLLMLVLLLAAAIIAGCGKSDPQEAAENTPADKLSGLMPVQLSPEELVAFVPDVVVAVGGETLLTGEELKAEMLPLIKHALSQGQGVRQEAVQHLAEGLSETLSNTKLALRAARELGITADEARVQKKLAEITDSINAADKSVPNRIDAVLEQLGMTMEALRQKVTVEVIIEQYTDHITAQIAPPAPPTEEEMRKEFAELSKSGLSGTFEENRPILEQKAMADRMNAMRQVAIDNRISQLRAAAALVNFITGANN